MKKVKELKIIIIILIFVLITLIVIDGVLTYLTENSTFILKVLELITATSSAITISISFSLNITTNEKNIENKGEIVANGNQTIVNGNGNVVNSNDVGIVDSLNKVSISLEAIKKENQIEIIKKVCEQVEKKNIHNSVDKDFIIKYLDEASLISDSDIQDIWAKLLISKSINSQNISKRTLDIVKNLSSKEAKIFEKVALLSHYDGVIVKDSCSNIPFLELTRLQDVGLLKSGDFITQNFSIDANNISKLRLHDTFLLMVNPSNEKAEFSYSCYLLSEEGKQLANALGLCMPVQGQIDFGKFLKSKFNNLQFHLYKIVKVDAIGNITYDTSLDLI